MKNGIKRNLALILALLLAFCLAFTSCELPDTDNEGDFTKESVTGIQATEKIEQRAAEKALGVPVFSGIPYTELNKNEPTFTETEKTVEAYEFYSELDSFGRCGYAMSCVGKELMPTEDRESISSVTPSGWINKKYDTELVEGGYIYNRCHLIGFQLTGENANKKNLITGTRYMNVDGMLPFENMIADYIKETDNHVMYRVTPVYDGNDLVACGVKLEAYSVEDNGEGISFNVYVYNVQPGICIDYATGNSWLSGENAQTQPKETEKNTEKNDENNGEDKTYVLNTSSKKFHLPDCSGAASIKDSNKQEYTGKAQDLINQGYDACGICKPAA